MVVRVTTGYVPRGYVPRKPCFHTTSVVTESNCLCHNDERVTASVPTMGNYGYVAQTGFEPMSLGYEPNVEPNSTTALSICLHTR